MVKTTFSVPPKQRVAAATLRRVLVTVLLIVVSSGQATQPSARQSNSPAIGGVSPSGNRGQSIIAQTRQGSVQAQQEFVCELYDADKHRMQGLALEDLPRIGGWYSIQFYRELLSPAALIKYRKARTKPENRNTATKEPVWWSLTSLPKVAPNPPPIATPDSSFDSAKVQQYAQIWRDWLQANEATLKTLQPTGDGVDFSGRRCSQAFRFRLPAQQVRR